MNLDFLKFLAPLIGVSLLSLIAAALLLTVYPPALLSKLGFRRRQRGEQAHDRLSGCSGALQRRAGPGYDLDSRV